MCTTNRISPLYKVCQNGNNRAQYKFYLDKAPVTGTSPLFISCQNGHDKMVQILLKNGADINLSDNMGNCPLFISCQNGHHETVKRH